MAIKRLAGPSTHICWTPDHVPSSQRKQVVLVDQKELVKLEDDLIRYRQAADAMRSYIGERPFELLAERDAGNSLIGATANPAWVRVVADLSALAASVPGTE